jgi:hypothetical protein
MTVLSYAEPEKFLERLDLTYQILQPLVALFMISDTIGIVTKINYVDDIKKFHSFYAMKLATKEGEKISVTVDYQTSPGMIYLSHSSYEVIQLDKAHIRELEKTMFETL